MSKDNKGTKVSADTKDTDTTGAAAKAPCRGRKAGVTMTPAEKAQMALNRVTNLIESDKLTNPVTWQKVDPAKVKAICEAANKGVENAKAARIAELKAKLVELGEEVAPVASV